MLFVNSPIYVAPLSFKRADRNVPNAFAGVSYECFEKVKADLLTHFCPEEIEEYQELKHEKKKKEYLLGRYACKLAAGFYLKEKKLQKIKVVQAVVKHPVIKHLSVDTPEITLSHCYPVVVALAHEAGHVVGIDIEQRKASKTRAFERGMTQAEIKLCQKAEDISFDLMANVLWTVKEALSKVIKCGLTVPFKLLEVDKMIRKNENEYCVTFKNFFHLHCYAYILEKHILSIALPIKTKLTIDKQVLGLR